MDNVGLVESVLNLTGFDVIDGLGNVHGYGSGLGVGHKALGAKYAAQTAYNAHHVRSCHNYVKVQPALVLDLRDQLLSAYIVCACSLSLVGLRSLCEYQNTNYLAGAVRQHDGSTDLLVSVTSVTACSDMGFYSLVKFGRSILLNQCNRICGVIKCSTVYILKGLCISFT